MTPLAALLLVVLGILVVALPRRYAAIPLLIGACYSGPLATLDIGISMTVLRILVLVGLIRVLARGEKIEGGLNRIDGWLLAWAALLLMTSVFHIDGAFIYRAGVVWEGVGCYFLLRIFIRGAEEVEAVFKLLCIVLVPIALSMLLEKMTGRNLFALLGGFADPIVRDGHIRARGPFTHPILAGTAGAACFPMALYLWRNNRKHALIGIAACLGIVIASTSSGPIMMVVFGLVGLFVWHFREYMRLIRWGALFGVIALDIVMKDPVYFLMARIDLTGSSTGYFRAQLIRSSIEHLNEWWLWGTDYTRHWMASGIYANERHTDITNHLLGIGVLGGLPCIVLFVCVLVAGFSGVGRALRQAAAAGNKQHQWLIWVTGAILFAHITNFFSISLFDQSLILFYLVLVCIGSFASTQYATAPATAAPGRRGGRRTMPLPVTRPRMVRR